MSAANPMLVLWPIVNKGVQINSANNDLIQQAINSINSASNDLIQQAINSINSVSNNLIQQAMKLLSTTINSASNKTTIIPFADQI